MWGRHDMQHSKQPPKKGLQIENSDQAMPDNESTLHDDLIMK